MFLRFEEMKQIGQGQQVRTAAGRKIFCDKTVIQHGKFNCIRVRLFFQALFQFRYYL